MTTVPDPEHPCPLHRTWASTIGIFAMGAATGLGITFTICHALGAI